MLHIWGNEWTGRIHPRQKQRLRSSELCLGSGTITFPFLFLFCVYAEPLHSSKQQAWRVCLSMHNVPWRFYEASPLQNIPGFESHFYGVEWSQKTEDNVRSLVPYSGSRSPRPTRVWWTSRLSDLNTGKLEPKYTSVSKTWGLFACFYSYGFKCYKSLGS